MKLRLSFAFVVPFLVSAAIAGVAHAQVTVPNYWVINTSSSTISPRIPGLQVPCADVSNGCVAGAGSTTINGVTGPNYTFSIVPTSSVSSVTTSSAQIFLNLLKYASSSDITVSPTGTIVFANHNISQFANDAGYTSTTLPQGLATTSSPTFAAETISGNVTSTSQTVTSDGQTVNLGSGNNASTSIGFENSRGTVGYTNATSTGDAGYAYLDSGSGKGIALCPGGNATATNCLYITSSSQIFAPLLNGNVYIPNQTFLTNLGCPAFPSVTTLDVCVNDWYTALASIASSTNFYLAGTKYTFSDSTGFVFTTAGERASMYGVGGNGTIVNDTAATGTIGTISWGTGTFAGATIQDITIQSSVTTATTSAQGGVIGWSVNSPYLTFREDTFNQGSIQVYLGTNTYLNTFDDDYFSYAGYSELYAPNSVNSGEGNTITNTVFGPMANNNPAHCVYLNTDNTNISAKSNDGCQLEVGSLAHVSRSGVHTETILSNGSYGAYVPIQVDAGGVFTENNADYMNDGVGVSSTPEFVLCNGTCDETAPILWANPSSTPNFITGSGTWQVRGANIQNSAGTANPNTVIGFATTSVSLSSCGGGASVIGSDNAGIITTGSSTSGCTLNFSPVWKSTPACVFTNATSTASFVRTQQLSTSSDNFGDSTNYATSTKLDYVCFGNPS